MGTGQKFAAMFGNSFSNRPWRDRHSPFGPPYRTGEKVHRLPVTSVLAKSPAGRFVTTTTVEPPARASHQRLPTKRVPSEGMSILPNKPAHPRGQLPSDPLYVAANSEVQKNCARRV